ncbi:hypothetical protein CN899_25260 [Bacillus thuringiensis]|uniref:Uncharacterized protein n=1 Tax=Bacillus thuringiensis TaxID=1428 RepID=A0A9X7BV10_BACTU|nr:hypothetical protein CN899_25260 [Bacillus thuringiensis]
MIMIYCRARQPFLLFGATHEYKAYSIRGFHICISGSRESIKKKSPRFYIEVGAPLITVQNYSYAYKEDRLHNKQQDKQSKYSKSRKSYCLILEMIFLKIR